MQKSSIASRLKAATTRQVTLTTGDVVTVRRLTVQDYLFLNSVPATYAAEVKATADGLEGAGDDVEAKRAAVAGAMSTETLGFMNRLITHCVTACITTPGFRVVDKPADQVTGDGEFPLELLPDEDVAAIYNGVMDASGTPQKKEAVEAARRFPGQPGADAVAGSNGAEVQPAAQ